MRLALLCGLRVNPRGTVFGYALRACVTQIQCEAVQHEISAPRYARNSRATCSEHAARRVAHDLHVALPRYTRLSRCNGLSGWWVHVTARRQHTRDKKAIIYTICFTHPFINTRTFARVELIAREENAGRDIAGPEMTCTVQRMMINTYRQNRPLLTWHSIKKWKINNVII